MKVKNSTMNKCQSLIAIGCLCFSSMIDMSTAMGTKMGHLDFSSDTFLKYELEDDFDIDFDGNETGNEIYYEAGNETYFEAGNETDYETTVPIAATPTDSPTLSEAPTSSQRPTSQPTVSLAPSDNPTESPAPSPSPSQAPTMVPTKTDPPTMAPSATPTESPAPSPSPSSSPTLSPTTYPSAAPSPAPTLSQEPSTHPTPSPSGTPSGTPSDTPSAAPSISSQPSSEPSMSPTIAPTATPSDQPSFAPTISVAPSGVPSATPSAIPSPAPSEAPTDAPTDSPSVTPSDSPSSFPTAAPSVSMAPTTSEPSSAPSATPTEVNFKTKSGITDVFLMDVDREMADTPLAQFEITTLEFVQDTQTSTPGYAIDLLAVTVLTQEVIYPESETDDETGMQNNLATVGLQVSFRTVGVVTEGTAPRDLDFTSITDAGFEYYFGEYLHRLSMADPFFQPLTEHVDTTTLLPLPEQPKTSKKNSDDDDNDSRNKTQFVAAVLFATLAILIAITATVYAVRKHLRKQSSKIPRLEYPGYGTKTMSEDPESADEGDNQPRHYDCDVLSDLSATQAVPKHQKERVRNTSMPLQLDIEDEKIEMEEIGLTPMSLPSDYGTAHGFSSAKKPLRKSVSPSAMERGTSDDDTGTGTFLDLKKKVPFGFGVRKWLTPRRSSPRSKAKIDLSDPPETETNFDTGNGEKPAKKSRKSIDPDAIKASTGNAAGILSDEQTARDEHDTKRQTSKSKRKSSSGGNGSFGVPVSFFGRSGDNQSEATSGNMDSMIGGSTASSFFTKMGRKSNDFTGWPSAQSDAVHDQGNAKATTNTYKFGSTGGKNNGNSFLNEENLAVFNTNSREDVEVSASEKNDYFNNKQSILETSQSSATGPPTFGSAVAKESRNIDDTNKSVELVLEGQEEQDPFFERGMRDDSVYSEQSELDLNALGVETTLGAVPSKYDNNDTPASRNSSFVGHEYGSRPIPFHPSTSAGALKSGEAAGKQEEATKPDFTLGARAMAAEEEKRRMSLSTAIKQGDTYDVFAPAGPIGIVVDTSKMGPAVHSLKSTSPMLGLINPGDLLIALDDEDTRNMTAASLTRLMAKRSRQKERKITLLAPDGF